MRVGVGVAVVALSAAGLLAIPGADACTLPGPMPGFSELQRASNGDWITFVGDGGLAAWTPGLKPHDGYRLLTAGPFVVQHGGPWIAYLTDSGRSSPPSPGSCGSLIDVRLEARAGLMGDPVRIAGAVTDLHGTPEALFGLQPNASYDEGGEWTYGFEVWSMPWGNWTRQTILTGTGYYSDLTVSRDGTWIALGSSDELVVHDRSTGKTLDLSAQPFREPAFSPDSRSIAFLEQEGQESSWLIVRDLETDRSVRHVLRSERMAYWTLATIVWENAGIVVAENQDPTVACPAEEHCTTVHHTRDPFTSAPGLIARPAVDFQGGLGLAGSTIALGSPSGVLFIDLPTAAAQGSDDGHDSPVPWTVTLLGLAVAGAFGLGRRFR